MNTPMGDSDVVLLGFWSSVYVLRVRIALAEKGVKYEYREEDFSNKSPLLLLMNPVHETVPVLIHHGKPICDSNIIVEYIDETWRNNSPPLLPSDPYLRAQSRFWVDFIDKKVYQVAGRLWITKGEDLEVAKKELIDLLKVVEGQLGGKPYLIGDGFGYADMALAPLIDCFYSIETIGKMSIEKESPEVSAWAKRCMERESVSKSLPHPLKVYEFVLELQKKHDQ